MRIGVILGIGAVVSTASPASATETVTYGYDVFGRLVASAHSGSVNNGLQQSYANDATDNRTGVTVTGSPFSSASRLVVVAVNGTMVLPLAPGS